MRSNPNYARFVNTGTFADSDRDKKFLVGMGLAGEGGEVCDYLKKVLLHGKPLDRDKLIEELGDVIWYLQLACNVFEIDPDEIVQRNIFKLCDRYPTHYGTPDNYLTDKEWYGNKSENQVVNLGIENQTLAKVRGGI